MSYHETYNYLRLGNKQYEMAIGDCILAKISQYDDHTSDENDDNVDD